MLKRVGIQSGDLKLGLYGIKNRSPSFYQQQRPSSQHTTEPLTSQDPIPETSNQSSQLLLSAFSISSLGSLHIHAQEAVVMGSDSNSTYSDENSEADKSRRAQYSRRMDEMNDSPAADL